MLGSPKNVPLFFATVLTFLHDMPPILDLACRLIRSPDPIRRQAKACRVLQLWNILKSGDLSAPRTDDQRLDLIVGIQPLASGGDLGPR